MTPERLPSRAGYLEAETREQFENRVIESVINLADGHLYRSADKLPYHNIEHMYFVHDKVMEYCDYVEQNGKKVDRFALRLAAIFHDASYFDNLPTVNNRLTTLKIINKPFPSKEHYSAWVAGTVLESFGVETRQINKVQRLIKKTNVNAKPSSLEDKIIVRADLDNISGPRQSFVMNTLKLVREEEILKGPMNPFERIAFSHRILSKYIAKDLCFGDFDRDIYDRTFRKPAVANIARLADHNIRGTITRIGKRAVSAVLPSLDLAA